MSSTTSTPSTSRKSTLSTGSSATNSSSSSKPSNSRKSSVSFTLDSLSSTASAAWKKPAPSPYPSQSDLRGKAAAQQAVREARESGGGNGMWTGGKRKFERRFSLDEGE